MGRVAGDHRPRRTGIEAVEREGGGNVAHVGSGEAKPERAEGDVDPIGLAGRLHKGGGGTAVRADLVVVPNHEPDLVSPSRPTVLVQPG
ncbi:MAG TPA: hypothetical protein VFU31_06915, partial [Candidatus Binatia bacterium]|nr:hypothetical protein [Candidatus Binatia bacterium]